MGQPSGFPDLFSYDSHPKPWALGDLGGFGHAPLTILILSAKFIILGRTTINPLAPM